MARIRTIKPEFPQSESIGRLTRDARLLFIMLWTLVDDAGRTRAASRMLASLLYPYDEDAPALMEGWLSELESQGTIRRYVVDGSHYLEVCNWLKHQKIDRPSESKLPPQSVDSTNPREGSRAFDADLGPRTLDLDQGSEPNGSGAPAPLADCDPKAVLFRDGLSELARLSHKSEKALRPQLGRWMQRTGDDATAILQLIDRCSETKRADPVAWIEACLKPRGGQSPPGKPQKSLARMALEGFDDDERNNPEPAFTGTTIEGRAT